MPSPRIRPALLFSASVLLALFISSCGSSSGGGYGGGGGGGGTPALHATITTSGNFSAGEMGATYTINVTNTGTAATSGTTTVVDPPAGFTVTAMIGTGWMCTVATTTCTYANSVPAGQAFPVITVTGNVTATNGSSVTISLMLSGGGAASASSSPTVGVAAVALSITKSHTGNFTQAQMGATYSVVVSNAAGAGATGGMVTVTEAPPTGLTVTSMTGTSWSCTAVTPFTCTRSDSLAGGSSYDTITVTVKVATNAPATLTNQVTVTGGNESGTESANDTTTIIPLPILQITTSSLPSGTAGAAYGPSGTGATVTASGGVSPYTWTITGLPSGLTFTSGTPSATISGSTCQVNSFMVKATVTDSASPTAAVVSATITLTIGPGALSITTASPLTSATFNSAYSTMVTAASGCAPYTWSLATGSSLPTMLSLATGSPSATISGTPSVTGTYKFTLQVTDSESPALTVSATFLLTSTESANVTCPTTVNLTLCGTYIMGLRGFNDPAGPIGLGGDFVADNAGHIATSGTEDINSSASATGGQTFTITGGSYAMDASGDGRGVVTLIYSDASSTSYRFALVSANSAAPGNDSPIEEFDASGALASGVIVGPKALPLVPPAPGFLALSLEGANGAGKRVGLLGEIQFAGSVTIGCDGTSGTFVSIAGANALVNTQGTISNNVTFAGSCLSDNHFGTTGRSTAMATVSGAFANSTLHFVFYQLTFSTYFFLETDPIAQSQPILSGIANVLTPVSGQTGFFVDCPCIFTEHGTTDGTITGHTSATVTRLVSAPAGSGGTLTGIQDQNAGGAIISGAAVTGTYTVNNNGVGTMTLTAPTARTIHFIIDGFDGTNNSSSYNFDTLDESASVDVGVSHAQFNTAIPSTGSPYVFGMGFDDLPYGLAFGYGNPGTTPLNAQTVGVVTPTGSSSGTLSGLADVMPGLVSGSAASGSYTIDSTTGRGTGSVSLTNGNTINAVYWVLGIGKFLVLDVQTADPDLIGARQQ